MLKGQLSRVPWLGTLECFSLFSLPFGHFSSCTKTPTHSS